MSSNSEAVVNLLVEKCLETEKETGPGTATLVWLTTAEVATGIGVSLSDAQAALDLGVREGLVLKGTADHEGKYALNDPEMNTKYAAV